MKVISDALAAHFGLDSMTLAVLWKVVRDFTPDPPALIQYAGGQFDTGIGNTTGTVSFTANVTSGNAILVDVGGEDLQGATVTDNLGNVYTQLLSVDPIIPPQPRRCIQFAAYGVTGGACTITVVANFSAAWKAYVLIHEFQGVGEFLPVDTTASADGTGTVISTPAYNTNVADIAFSFIYSQYAATPTDGAAFIQSQTGGSGPGPQNIFSSSWIELDTPGTYTTSWSQGTSGGWIATTVLLKQASNTQGFTTHDEDINYLGTTYYAGSGMTNTATANKSDLSVDNSEVTALLVSDSDAITEIALRAGEYDYATVEIRIVNWADLTMGDLKVKSGTVGQVVMKNGMFTSEIRGLSQYFTTVIGSLYGPLCRAELGSGFNGIDVNTQYPCCIDITKWRQTGVVESSVDPLHVVPAVTLSPFAPLLQPGSATPTAPAPNGWFNDGVMTFTSGPLKGFTVEIKSWDGTTLTMFLPLQYQPNVGDSFIIEPGCDKTAPTCFAKFNNIVNFKGENTIPGNDLVLLYPNAQ